MLFKLKLALLFLALVGATIAVSIFNAFVCGEPGVCP